MERPLGPRAPPPSGDRNRAFESIFGRPSAVHHISQQHQQPQFQYSQGGVYLHPGHSGQYARSPSPSGYLSPSQGAQQQQQQPFRAPQDPARYPYPLQQSQTPQGSLQYPPSTSSLQPASPYVPSDGYVGDMRQGAPDQPSYSTGAPPSGYAPSIAPSERPPVSVRHSIQYNRPGSAAIEPGYQSIPQPATMTAAQAYQAQVYREHSQLLPQHHSLQHSYSDFPQGAAPPPTFNSAAINASNAAFYPANLASLQSSSTGQRLLSQSSSSSSSFLPPVNTEPPLDLDDVLDGPSMTARRYPLRSPPQDADDSFSLGDLLIDSHKTPQPSRITSQSSLPRSSMSSGSLDDHHSAEHVPSRHRLSNDSAHTLPYARRASRAPLAESVRSGHHRRSSTTEGSMRTTRGVTPPSASTTQGNAAARTSLNNNKAMPPLPHTLPRYSLPSSASPRPRLLAQPQFKPIYPALLSLVAASFQARISASLSERGKDGLAYKDAFDGREAVTKLAEIIKTTDRNLALLLGRALDAQKFFHDVTYDHRLRDSAGELYQFRTSGTAMMGPGYMPGGEGAGDPTIAASSGAKDGTGRPATPQSQLLQQSGPGLSGTESPGLESPVDGRRRAGTSPIPAPTQNLSSPTISASEHSHGTLDFGGMAPPPYSYGLGNNSASTTLEEELDSQRRTIGGDASSSHLSPTSPEGALSLSTIEDGASPFPITAMSSGSVLDTSPQQQQQISGADSRADDQIPLPSGVFTLLTECYSPTCTRDRLCYSIACPRRLEQQARLNMQPQTVLKRTISHESLGDLVEPGTLWIHSVSQDVADSLTEKEKRRQEAINEVIYTERDFVRDMEYLREQWIKPLQTRDIIPEARRADFVTQVFWNVLEIIAVNTRLRDALTKRQKHRPIVDTIGDVLLEHVTNFEPFVKYGSHQLYGKYEFEKEKNSNPLFAQFVDEVERLPESRKLELNGYLTKPTTRLARYPLLLEACLKLTEDNHPDKTTIPKAVKIVRGFLERVNVESGKTENRFNLLQLDQQLVFRPGEAEDLRLLDENRELVYKGPLKRAQGDNADLQLFLFDHALLVVKAKTKHEQFKVHRKPIPLELLLISPTSDDPTLAKGPPGRPRNTLISKRNSTGSRAAGLHPLAPPPSEKPDPKGGFPITFIHLGRKGYSLTLWASTFISRKKWMDNITKQQEVLRERSTIFEPHTISQGYFSTMNRVNCAAPLNRGRAIVFGTDDGVYFADLREQNREPIKMLALAEVTQVDVLEEYQLLIVLSERAVITFPLDALDPRDPTVGLKRAKRVSSHTSFFKAGMCLGRMLVCVVKASALSTTIKTLEPIDQNLRGKNKPTFKKLLQGGNDTLKVFKEFYIPVESSSIHFLRTKLCVGCTKGFEIVDLETLDAQGLLDPNDSSLDFVQKRDNVRPMAIYRVDSEFLLCYEDFAFYINKNGWRSRPGWIIHWEGTPSSFALQYPYILAFEPTFVEIRHVETGLMAQVIPGTAISCLFADTPPSSDSAAPQHFFPSHPYPMGPPPGSQMSPFNSYGMQHPQGAHRHPHPHPSQVRPGYPPPRREMHKRGEIILSMDDRVVELRLSLPASNPPLPLPHSRSDINSVYSAAPPYTTTAR